VSVRELDAMVRAGEAIRGGIQRFESSLGQLERTHLRALAERLDIPAQRGSSELQAAIRRRLLGVRGIDR
jgi:hypothetical protein